MKKNSKRLLILLAAAVIILAGVFFLLPSEKEAPYGNLLKNADFSVIDEEGLPEGWYTDGYLYGVSSFDASAQGAHIQNNIPNDARFAQTISVAPNTLYCLTGKIKADTEGGWGANLSVENVYVYPESLYRTEGEWQEVYQYGYTGEDQTSITVYARLGGYSGESLGEAWFRDLSFHRVDEVPAGYYAQNFYRADTGAQQASPDTAGEKTGALSIVFGCIFYAALFLLLKKQLFAPSPLVKKTSGIQMLSLAGVLLLGFCLRLILALSVPGYDVDIGCFTAWSMHMAQVGPGQFYNTVSFCDYPPGYMNILWLIGLLGNHVGGVTELMVKMPAILSDMLICFILYKEGRRYLGHRPALLLSILWAAHPVSLVTGACWGQTDSLMTLLLLLSLLSLFRGQWKAALPVYVAAVLVKPQALMFGPMGVAALALHLKNTKLNKKVLADLAMGIGLSVAVFAVLALPFLVNIEGEKQGLFFLLDLYGSTMQSYGYVTINACNPYFLLGLNWLPSDYMASFGSLMLVWAIAAVPSLATCMIYRKQPLKKDVSFLYTAALSLVILIVLLVLYFTGSLTYGILSTCMIVCAVALLCMHFLLKGSMAHLPVFAAGMLLLLFACGGMMHERYLFPVVVLLFLGYLTTKDKRLLYLMLLVTMASFLNIACVLERNIRIGGVEAHLSAPMCLIESDLAVLEYLSALLTSLAALASVFVCLSPERENAPAREEDAAEKAEGFPPPALQVTHPHPLQKRDYLLMLGCTLLYAVLAFTNLGSTKAPQTAWVSNPTAGEESILLDLGEEKEFSVLYFPGILHYDSTLVFETGNDQAYWDMRSAQVTYANCFSWYYLTGTNQSPLSGRYVRLSTQNYDIPLYEVILRDAHTGETLPYQIIGEYENETVYFLNDEQDTLSGEPSWYNSTYFDEIYHARTGFEHLHGLPTYETTHPPLGKVMISWCIALFGMTPFGWRFAGALAGVLMLPAMYLLGRLLFKNKWGGLFALLMMAFDLMHFTQTRIATIDSFVVLFILWAVYFMLYWFKMDYFHTPFWKTLLPLSLSGLFMGLSIASKWTGCYNAVGLALIFFWGLFRRYRIWKQARDEVENYRNSMQKTGKKKQAEAPLAEPREAMAIAKQGASMIYTVLSCFLFFLAIPLVIYYLSYIPFYAYSGGVTVKKVIDNATHMFAYHSEPGRGMDHYFYSPWYEWPFIVTPMFYWQSIRNTPAATSAIWAMGNPAVWWTGLIGLFGVICLAVYQHVKSDLHWTENRRLSGQVSFSFFAKKDEPRFALLLILFLVQFLPWTLVPRGTYIYHYFPSVPFIILCTGLCLDVLHEKWKKAALSAGAVLLLAALLLFIAFFPYASGQPAPQWWMNMMKWFPGWIWY